MDLNDSGAPEMFVDPAKQRKEQKMVGDDRLELPTYWV